MDDGDGGEHGDLPAGPLSVWLVEVRSAIEGRGDAHVACGTCTACCASSQFVHIGPDEAEARAHIPRRLLFPAPGMPPGHVLLGYDEHGRCPMLSDVGCSIYEHRPRTCRTYDCRVFPATGLELGDEDDKPLIARQARRWRFTHPTARDEREHDALRAAARFVAAHAAELPEAVRPRSTTQLAVAALEAHAAFLDGEPELAAMRVALAPRRSRPAPP